MMINIIIKKKTLHLPITGTLLSSSNGDFDLITSELPASLQRNHNFASGSYTGITIQRQSK